LTKKKSFNLNKILCLLSIGLDIDCETELLCVGQ